MMGWRAQMIADLARRAEGLSISIGRERVDDGTAGLAVRRIALPHQLGERFAHRSQIGQLALDDLQLAARQLARLLAGVRLFEPKQTGDFLQRESRQPPQQGALSTVRQPRRTP